MALIRHPPWMDQGINIWTYLLLYYNYPYNRSNHNFLDLFQLCSDILRMIYHAVHEYRFQYINPFSSSVIVSYPLNPYIIILKNNWRHLSYDEKYNISSWKTFFQSEKRIPIFHLPFFSSFLLLKNHFYFHDFLS